MPSLLFTRVGLITALASSLAASNPLATPTPPPIPTCTTWITKTDYGFRGSYTPLVAWTVYTSTKTAFEHVPCNGCVLSVTETRAALWGGIGPEEEVTGTTTATDPFTVTSTVCAAAEGRETPHHGQIPRPRGLRWRGVALAAPDTETTTTTTTTTPTSATGTTPTTPTTPTRGPDCTTTQLRVAPMTFGAVQTVWTATATTTEHVDCGGCRFLATSVRPMQPGPVVNFTATTTASGASVETSLVCLKTPSVVRGGGGGSTGTPPPATSTTGTAAATAETILGGHREKRCTRTVVFDAPAEADDDGGATHTVWPATVTGTTSVACHGCVLATGGAAAPAAAERKRTATTTTAREPSKALEVVCARSTGGAQDGWGSGGTSGEIHIPAAQGV